MKLPRFNFSYKISIIGLILILIFCRLSYWQYTRHEEKKNYIALMQERLETEPRKLVDYTDSDTDWTALSYRKLWVSGVYDYSKEVVLRNRRLEGVPGVHVITPLKIDQSEDYVLVNRGFVPLDKSKKDQRDVFHKKEHVKFLGLVKMSRERKAFAPKDPKVDPNSRWVDSWLRVDVAKMQKQIPYKLLPISLEIVSDSNNKYLAKEIVQSKSGKSELLSLPLRAIPSARNNDLPKNLDAYPIPVFNTIIPPGRHFGYIFEWLFIALLTFCICFLLQLRRN